MSSSFQGVINGLNSYRDPSGKPKPIKRTDSSRAPTPATPFTTFGDIMRDMTTGDLFMGVGFSPDTGFEWVQIVEPSGATAPMSMWQTVSGGGSTSMVAYYGYIVTDQSELLLPVNFVVGTVIYVIFQAIGGKIVQNVGQQILSNNGNTTIGGNGFVRTENPITMGLLVGTSTNEVMTAYFTGNVLIN